MIGRCSLVFSAFLTLPGGALAAGPVAQNDGLNATLWVSNSVEFQGNTAAVFELAKIRLDQALADKTWTATGQTGSYQDLPPAIIADLDETFLDNGGYENWLVATGKDFSSRTWNVWVADAEAKAVPGALDFARYADGKGVKVFYVSNRTADQEEATRKNMAALGFPMGGNVDTFLMAKEQPDWTAKKGTRRDFIGKDYRVLLLLGDNYADFSDGFTGTEANRLKDFEANKAHIAHDWLFVANPEYGSFESAPFSADYKLSPDERRQKKIDALASWKGPPAQ
jgi:acid phosphatase